MKYLYATYKEKQNKIIDNPPILPKVVKNAIILSIVELLYDDELEANSIIYIENYSLYILLFIIF